jgi:SAM-dependent methyltransferase
MLEIGTGSAGIANYFGVHASLDCDVTAVDVVDQRQTTEGYRFELVQGTTLPFADDSFDVVLSNHVIEHVGARHAQLAHLCELRRVLAPSGKGYLAVPNRWMLVEPHYRLAMLSWLPRTWRTPYLQLARRGQVYDCEPLERAELESLLRESRLQGVNVCIEALRATFEIERSGRLSTRILRQVPDALIRPFGGVIPTLIYRLRVADPV